MREYYNKLPRKDQESFDQDEISLRALLGLDPDRVYTIEDLNDEEVHDRALRLLYRARLGQVNEYARISPHINYDQLDRTVSDHIISKLSVAAGISYVHQHLSSFPCCEKIPDLDPATSYYHRIWCASRPSTAPPRTD